MERRLNLGELIATLTYKRTERNTAQVLIVTQLRTINVTEEEIGGQQRSISKLGI